VRKVILITSSVGLNALTFLLSIFLYVSFVTLRGAPILFPQVYPETKGVPLEEMDAVFGEGDISRTFKSWMIVNAVLSC
jgi:hypothetical protein